MKTNAILCALLIGAASTSSLQAGFGPFETYSRQGKPEIFAFGEYRSGANTVTSSGGTTSLKFDSGYGGGINFGYNILDFLNINTEVAGAGVDLTGSGFGSSVSTTPTILDWRVGLDYNILRTRLTPFVTAGVGITYFNGDFGVAGSSFSETDLSWNVGGGLRYDITDHWFVKAMYRANWVSLKDTSAPSLFNIFSIGLGFSF